MQRHLSDRMVGHEMAATNARPAPRAASALPPFPPPFKVNGINFWRRGDIRRYQAAVAGCAFEPRESDDEWMQSDQVRLQLGSVSSMWIHRRLRESRGDGIAPEAA